MRLVFAGTPEVAVPSLRALVDAGHEVVAVVTRPDAPSGRGKKLSASPLAQAAEQLSIPVLKPRRADAHFAAELAGLKPDVCPVVAFGALLPPQVLQVPAHGWVNLHFSLLPTWRGAAPVQRALMAGQTTTGATTFRLVKDLDAGPVWRQLHYQIAPEATSGDVLADLAQLGAALLEATLDDIAAGVEPVEQAAGDYPYADKLSVDEVQVDWSRGAQELSNLIRGASPHPGAWSVLDGQRFKLLRAVPDPGSEPLPAGQLRAGRRHLWVGTGAGVLELQQVQAFGKKPMRGPDWARGVHWPESGLSFEQ